MLEIIEEEENNAQNQVEIVHLFSESELIKQELQNFVEFLTSVLLCYLILILTDQVNSHFAYSLIPFLFLELKNLLQSVILYNKSNE